MSLLFLGSCDRLHNILLSTASIYAKETKEGRYYFNLTKHEGEIPHLALYIRYLIEPDANLIKSHFILISHTKKEKIRNIK